MLQMSVQLQCARVSHETLGHTMREFLQSYKDASASQYQQRRFSFFFLHLLNDSSQHVELCWLLRSSSTPYVYATLRLVVILCAILPYVVHRFVASALWKFLPKPNMQKVWWTSAFLEDLSGVASVDVCDLWVLASRCCPANKCCVWYI